MTRAVSAPFMDERGYWCTETVTHEWAVEEEPE